jgi:hypothetical protein
MENFGWTLHVMNHRIMFADIVAWHGHGRHTVDFFPAIPQNSRPIFVPQRKASIMQVLNASQHTGYVALLQGRVRIQPGTMKSSQDAWDI